MRALYMRHPHACWAFLAITSGISFLAGVALVIGADTSTEDPRAIVQFINGLCAAIFGGATCFASTLGLVFRTRRLTAKQPSR